MKKLFALVICVLTLSSLAYAVEHKSPSQQKQPKLYVAVENVKITDNGIFLVLDGQLVPVKAVRSDKKGLYVTGTQTKDSTDLYMKTCRNCRKTFISRGYGRFCSIGCRTKALERARQQNR